VTGRDAAFISCKTLLVIFRILYIVHVQNSVLLLLWCYLMCLCIAFSFTQSVCYSILPKMETMVKVSADVCRLITTTMDCTVAWQVREGP
jgi:hypothetical protein